MNDTIPRTNLTTDRSDFSHNNIEDQNLIHPEGMC